MWFLSWKPFPENSRLTVLLCLFQFFKKSFLSRFFPPWRLLKFLFTISCSWGFSEIFFFLNQNTKNSKKFLLYKTDMRTLQRKKAPFCSSVSGLPLLLPSQCYCVGQSEFWRCPGNTGDSRWRRDNSSIARFRSKIY